MTTKQRACLKGLAMTMEPILQIGKSSLTPELTAAVDEALEARELIKISVLKNCFDDSRQLAQISPALTSSLGALSQHIKIIPMGDDERATCIVETPEEIIDASVSPQMTNIRDLLRDQMGAF